MSSITSPLAASTPMPNGHSHSNSNHSATDPLQLALPLPNSFGQAIHLHLTIRSTVLQLFVTTSSNGAGGLDLAQGGGSSALSAMGSLVFAMPDAISTRLYTQESTLDFATRLAKVLAIRSKKGIYVSSSASFANCVNGGTVDEEMDAFRRIVNTVLEQVKTT